MESDEIGKAVISVVDENKPPEGWSIVTDGHKFAWKINKLGYVGNESFATCKSAISDSWSMARALERNKRESRTPQKADWVPVSPDKCGELVEKK